MKKRELIWMLQCACMAANLQKDKNPVTTTWAPSETQHDFVPPHPALWKALSASSWHNGSHIRGDKSAKLPLQAHFQDVSHRPQ